MLRVAFWYVVATLLGGSVLGRYMKKSRYSHAPWRKDSKHGKK